MADTNSQQDAVDTGLSSADEASTFEDAEDIVGSMEDVEVDVSELDDESEDEAATESEESEDNKSSEEVEEVDEQSETKEEAEDTSESEAEQKRRNDEYARRRIEEKQQREALKQQQQNQFLQDAEDPRDLALRQLQIDAYNNRVQTNNNLLESQLDRAVADIQEFRDGSEEVKEELINAVDEFEQMYVVRDRNGDPIEVRASLRDFLQAKAERIRKLTGAGARNQVVAKAKTKAKTDPVPTRKPATPKIDPMLAAFDEEASQ